MRSRVGTRVSGLGFRELDLTCTDLICLYNRQRVVVHSASL